MPSEPCYSARLVKELLSSRHRFFSEVSVVSEFFPIGEPFRSRTSSPSFARRFAEAFSYRFLFVLSAVPQAVSSRSLAALAGLARPGPHPFFRRFLSGLFRELPPKPQSFLVSPLELSIDLKRKPWGGFLYEFSVAQLSRVLFEDLEADLHHGPSPPLLPDCGSSGPRAAWIA